MRVASHLLLSVACLVQVARGDLNVYGKPLASCGTGGPGSGEGDVCPYRHYDAGAHEVCVKSLPGGFSSATGQGPWSDEYIGKPWCICIWAYSNYVLHHPDAETNLPIQCDAIPERVLMSTYALNNFKQCGSMASPCNAYDQAIRKMCNHCQATAPDEIAKASLMQKCDEILAAAGDGGSSYQRLYFMGKDQPAAVAVGPANDWQAFTSIFFPASALLGTMALTFYAFRVISFLRTPRSEESDVAEEFPEDEVE